jgi:hypothetical protein
MSGLTPEELRVTLSEIARCKTEEELMNFSYCRGTTPRDLLLEQIEKVQDWKVSLESKLQEANRWLEQAGLSLEIKDAWHKRLQEITEANRIYRTNPNRENASENFCL